MALRGWVEEQFKTRWWKKIDYHGPKFISCRDLIYRALIWWKWLREEDYEDDEESIKNLMER